MFGTAMHALKDDDKIVRCSAANSLQKFGAIDKPGLLAAAKDSDARVRAGAIAAIGALYDELEAPSSLLLEALSDSDALVRARAAYVISVLDSQIPNAKNALERLAQDPDERVRWLVRDIEEPTSDH
jgi:HEAT repeat protein